MPGKKRKVSDVPINIEDDPDFFPKLLQSIENMKMPYKHNAEQIQLRDQALVATFILTGLRNREKEQLHKGGENKNISFFEKHNTQKDQKYGIITGIQPEKKGAFRKKIWLPQKGTLAPFTEIFIKWYNLVPEDAKYFFPAVEKQSGKFLWNKPLGRHGTYKIIRKTTGKFPHWFRAVCANIYGRLLFDNNPYELCDFMGWKNLDSSKAYIASSWERHKREIMNLKTR